MPFGPNLRKMVMVILSKLRKSVLLALSILLLSPLVGPASGVFGVEAAQAQTINRINVSGNERVDDETVISYLTVRVGDTATRAKLTASTNALMGTGLFSSAKLAMSGYTLNVNVIENMMVGSVLFEGNKRLSDNNLTDMVSLSTHGTFSEARLQSDLETIRLAYERAGYKGVKVTARKENADDGRLRIVFVVDEGDRVGIASVTFTGNSTFGAGTLKDVIRTKESNWMSWLFQDDLYDEDKLTVDRELIRLYYVNHGYPDAQVLSAIGEYDASRNAYFVNFSISEGERYTFGDIGIETSIVGLNTDALKGRIRTNKGVLFSQSKLDASTENLAIAAADQGFSFADVRARVDRDIANKTFNITYLVDEGARVYVERVNIHGNNKTRDFVIRRELEFAEGDPFNRSILTRGKTKIESLGFFQSVDISTRQGSAPDKVVIDIAVVEKSSGDYGLTAGYSTDDGILGEVSVTETNFLGRGQYMKAALGASETGRSYTFSFTEPRFAGMKISTGFDFYKNIVDESSSFYYGTDTTGAKLRFSVPITEDLTATVFGGVDHVVYADKDGHDSVLVDDGDKRMKSVFGYTLRYMTIDSVKRPTTGVVASVTQQYYGWDANYLDTTFKARYYTPIMDDAHVVASLKAQGGFLVDFSGDGVNGLDAYRPGSQLVRGFKSSGMGARAASGEALGATYYAGLSAEIEFPIPGIPESYGLSTAFWGDVGYVGDTSDAVKAKTSVFSGMDQQLRSSVGASLIWESPFGPLRGDFAYVINKDDGDKTNVFSLSLKSVF